MAWKGDCAHSADEEWTQREESPPGTQRHAPSSHSSGVHTALWATPLAPGLSANYQQLLPSQVRRGQAKAGTVDKEMLHQALACYQVSPPLPLTLQASLSPPQCREFLASSSFPTHPEASDPPGPYPGDTCPGAIFLSQLISTYPTLRLAPAH